MKKIVLAVLMFLSCGFVAFSAENEDKNLSVGLGDSLSSVSYEQREAIKKLVDESLEKLQKEAFDFSGEQIILTEGKDRTRQYGIRNYTGNLLVAKVREKELFPLLEMKIPFVMIKESFDSLEARPVFEKNLRKIAQEQGMEKAFVWNVNDYNNTLILSTGLLDIASNTYLWKDQSEFVKVPRIEDINATVETLIEQRMVRFTQNFKKNFRAKDFKDDYYMKLALPIAYKFVSTDTTDSTQDLLSTGLSLQFGNRPFMYDVSYGIELSLRVNSSTKEMFALVDFGHYDGEDIRYGLRLGGEMNDLYQVGPVMKPYVEYSFSDSFSLEASVEGAYLFAKQANTGDTFNATAQMMFVYNFNLKGKE